MSRANAQFALPPGDRDDAAADAPSPQLQNGVGATDAAAGRKPELPTLLVLGKTLEERQTAFADLERAAHREDWPLAEAAALRLREACLPDMHILAIRMQREIHDHRRALVERRREEKADA